ncbi:MAG: class I SAM-dependent methyltransferase [Burkholderiales bacterium]|nr:class I SAM-dependent methyltransferase [Burkholderiales bacterium]
MRIFLHVGCGEERPERLPKFFRKEGWREVRVDIDPKVKPDIVANITDLQKIRSGSVDAIWSSHNIEHLHAFEVPLAFDDFRRVLKDDGFLMMTLPDLRAIARHIIADNVNEVLYQSQVGPIRPLDMLFGHQPSLERGNHFMAHRTGFTSTTLGQALLEAEFAEVRVHEGGRWDLWAIATMPQTSPEIFNEMAEITR